VIRSDVGPTGPREKAGSKNGWISRLLLGGADQQYNNHPVALAVKAPLGGEDDPKMIG